MILILSACINVMSPPLEPNKADKLSYAFAVVVLIAISCFIFLVIPYILIKYWKMPEEDRQSAAYPEFEVIVKKLNLKEKAAFFLPVENILYRTALCFLLLGTHGFTKSGLFHLLTLAFTIYIVATRPFDGNIENKIALANAVFMLLLTYMIIVVFSEITDYRTKYLGGFTTAGIVLLIIVINLLAVWAYTIKAAIR